MHQVSALGSQLQGAAESVAVRGGHLVPLRYGSAAGELAICTRSVGLVDREDLAVLAISGDPSGVDGASARLIGQVLDPGRALRTARGIWGRAAAELALVALPAAAAPLLCEDLLREVDSVELAVEKRPLQPIGLVGPETGMLLADLGVFQMPGSGQMSLVRIADAPTWLLLDEGWALMMVDPDRAVTVWNAVSVAGRHFDLGYVGAEAAERYESIRCLAGESVRP